MTEPTVPAQDAPPVQPAEEWKPEPRQWSWRDLFTAPMLAFKPKCMVVSAVTLLAIGAWMWLFDRHILTIDNSNFLNSIPGRIVEWAWYLVALVIFGVGAGLVAVFMKADLLDDEFLSFGEAINQYQPRALSAVLVPVFLVCLLAGAWLLMIWVPVFIAGIPWVGATVYALLYPLGFLASLFVVLLGIAVWLSVFVFPAIVAIRRHGWFDNVVDTVEAVGTKPHLLIGSLLLTLLMMFIAHAIGFAGMDQLKTQYRLQPGFKITDGVVWNDGTRRAEDGAGEYVKPMRDAFSDQIARRFDTLHLGDSVRSLTPFPHRAPFPSLDQGGWDYKGAGAILGFWQVVIAACIFGYLMNLFVAGGMLSYLVVREDDYWDDEDLEDLDKLAKELEEEAKREQAAETGATPATEPAKPADGATEPPKT